MHPKFLNVLCCPETGESLSLRAETIDRHGWLTPVPAIPATDVSPAAATTPRA